MIQFQLGMSKWWSANRLSHVLRQRRLEYTGHCQRAEQEVISSLLLWKPSGKVHFRKRTYVDTIIRDSGIPLENLNQAIVSCMEEDMPSRPMMMMMMRKLYKVHIESSLPFSTLFNISRLKNKVDKTLSSPETYLFLVEFKVYNQ